MFLRRALPWLAALLLTSVASAAPVTWILTATFNDGGTASGSLVFDASTGVFSSVNITTTTGSTRVGATYTRAHVTFAGPDFVLLLSSASGNLTGTPVFAANLVSPMTNSGGTILIRLTGFHEESSCVDAGCTGPTNPSRLITGGSVTGSPTVGGTMAEPTLGAWGLFALGLALAIFGMKSVRRAAC